MKLSDLIALFSETPIYEPLNTKLVERPQVKNNASVVNQNTNSYSFSNGNDTWSNTGYKNAILDAQVMIESGGNPNAVSSAGAIGLTQIMPGTLEWIKAQGWIPKNAKSTDPQTSLIAQERFMDHLYNSPYVKGYNSEQERIAMTLAAYNAGPGRLQDAIAKANKEGGSWYEKLPKETRKYIPMIMGHKYLNDGVYTPKYNRTV